MKSPASPSSVPPSPLHHLLRRTSVTPDSCTGEQIAEQLPVRGSSQGLRFNALASSADQATERGRRRRGARRNRERRTSGTKDGDLGQVGGRGREGSSGREGRGSLESEHLLRREGGDGRS